MTSHPSAVASFFLLVLRVFLASSLNRSRPKTPHTGRTQSDPPPSLYSQHMPTAQSTTTTLSSTQTFACPCAHTTITNTTSPSSSTSKPDASKPNLKPAQSGLSRYFGGVFPESSSAFSTPAPAYGELVKGGTSGPVNGEVGEGTGMGMGAGCGGKVEVTVEEDFSHPLGIRGQRVLVLVEH
jgi:hypothetical protein